MKLAENTRLLDCAARVRRTIVKNALHMADKSVMLGP